MPWTPYKFGIKRFEFPSVAGQSGHEISENFARVADLIETVSGGGDVGGLAAAVAELQERVARLFPYTHEQATPAAVWDIEHGLGRSPAAVSIFDADGTMVEGANVLHLTTDRLTASFSIAFTGWAVLG
jgi:hypothetical protein